MLSIIIIINFIILPAIINRGDILKDKQVKSGPFWSKIFPWFFAFNLLIYVQKEFPSYLHCFCIQSYREILKKYRKMAITLQRNNFSKIWEQFLDIHIRNVMPKFESSRLNGVAVIAKTHTHTHTPTYIHTYILPNLGNT